MRGADDVGHLPQRPVRPRRFGLIDVQGGAGHFAVLQGGQQGRLVDEAAPGAVDEAHSGLHLHEGFPAQQLGGVLGLGGMHGDEVGTGQEFVQGDQFRPDLGGQLPW